MSNSGSNAEALVEQIRAIIGSDTSLSQEQILALLQEANNDANKAVDLYFQQVPMSKQEGADEQKCMKENGKSVCDNVGEASDPPCEVSKEGQELNDLLGGNKSPHLLHNLLERADNDLSGAIDLYFSEEKESPDGEQAQSEADTPPPPHHDPIIHAHPLQPLSQPLHLIKLGNNTHDIASDENVDMKPGTYEVVVEHHDMKWKIGNVFDRVVVQWVDPSGQAAQLGIQKSDVLVSFHGATVTEENCDACVEHLSSEVLQIQLPVSLKLRRSTEHHELSSSGADHQSAATNSITYKESIGFSSFLDRISRVCSAVQVESKDIRTVVDILLNGDGSLDSAVNDFLSENGAKQDLRHVVGSTMDPSNPAPCFSSEPYEAIIPAGPLGLVVENILERTIVVDIKAGGAAERAEVKRKSWLLTINGVHVTHLTHRETLRMIESASRPLALNFIEIPAEDYNALRRQISVFVRQVRQERPIPEQDRMSFRVFQAKIEQVIEALPHCMLVAFFQYLTRDDFHQPESPSVIFPEPIEELLSNLEDIDDQIVHEFQQYSGIEPGENSVSSEYEFLLNMFRFIHEHDDRGENLVIKTIKFLGLLAKRCAQVKHHVARADAKVNDNSAVFEQRYSILIELVLHALEKISIIENHATWDAMIASMKLIVSHLTETEIDQLVVPMVSRLCVSPSPTARIVPAALASLVYPRLHGDICVQYRGVLDRMFNDDNPLVRRAVTSVLGDFVESSGLSSTSWGVILLEKANTDSHDLVRIIAVRSCVQMANVFRGLHHAEATVEKSMMDESLQLLLCQLVPMFNTYVSDSSWHVRYEVAHTLAKFCEAFGSNYSDVFVDYYVSMANDRVYEVKQALAESTFDLAQTLIELAQAQQHKLAEEDVLHEKVAEAHELSETMENLTLDGPSELSSKSDSEQLVASAQSKIIRSILPAAYKMSSEGSLPVCLSLAKSVGKCLQLVDASLYEEFIPIVTHLLNEQEATIRASLLEEMARYCESSSQTVAEIVFPCIKTLVESEDWRVRVKSVACLAAWGERCDRASVPEDVADTCLDLLKDPVYEVRAACCSGLPTMVKLLGVEWMTNKLVPRISDCLQSTFNGRQTGLLAVENIAEQLHEIGKLRDVVETVVEECTSKVANMRFRALRTLGLLVPTLNDPKTTESILEIIRELSSPNLEADRDVRATALQVQELLEQHQPEPDLLDGATEQQDASE